MKSKLGDYIAFLRESKGWTQRELARRVKYTPPTIQKIENGLTEHPGLDVVVAIAEALGVNELKLISAYKGQDPEYMGESKAQDHEILVNLVKQIPDSLILETRTPREIFKALIASKGREKMYELFQEALILKDELKKNMEL